MGGIFGGGDEPKQQTSTTTNNPYPAAKPGMDLFYKDLTNAYKGGALNLKPWMGDSVAPSSPETLAAWQGTADRAQAGSPLIDQSGAYLSRVLDPNYLFSDSPGLSSVLDAARNDVNAQFSMGGRTFSGAHAGSLGGKLGQIRYQDFARKAGEQQAAAGMAPGIARERYFDMQQLGQVGQQREAKLQDLINAEIERFNALQGGTANELGLFQRLLAGGGSGSTSTTQPRPTDNSNPVLQGIGTAAQIASLFL